MRLLHFADLHLSIESKYGRIDPQTRLNSRFLDFLKVLDEIVETAISADVDLVIFCGDAYKSSRPSPTEQREFAKRVSRLASNGIVVFLLTGNHDCPSIFEQATSLDIYQALPIGNVVVSNYPQVYRLRTKRGEIQLLSLPWPIHHSAFLAREECKGLSIDGLNSLLRERLTQIAHKQAENLDPSIPAVFVGHLTLDTAQTGQGLPWLVNEPIFLQSQLSSLPVGYIALGHIHRPQVLNADPPIVYSGSPERLDFSEAGEEKGVFLIELDRSVNFSFHRVGARPFFELKIEISPQENGREKIFKAIKQNQERIKGAVFRLNITSEGSTIDERGLREFVSQAYRELRDALSKACYIDREIISVKRQGRERVRIQHSKELTPLEALEIYFRHKKIPPERQKKLLEYARKLLSGI